MGPCCRYLPCNIRQQRLCTIVEQQKFTKNIISSIYNLIFFYVFVECLQTILETIMLRGHLYIPKQNTHITTTKKQHTPHTSTKKNGAVFCCVSRTQADNLQSANPHIPSSIHLTECGEFSSWMMQPTFLGGRKIWKSKSAIN